MEALLKASLEANENLVIGIQAHDEAKHQKVVELLQMTTEAGVKNLTFLGLAEDEDAENPDR